MISSHPSEILACVFNKILPKPTLLSPLIIHLHSTPYTPLTLSLTHSLWLYKQKSLWIPAYGIKDGHMKVPMVPCCHALWCSRTSVWLNSKETIQRSGTNNKSHPWGPDIQQSHAKVESLVLRRLPPGQSFLFHPSRWQSPYKKFRSRIWTAFCWIFHADIHKKRKIFSSGKVYRWRSGKLLPNIFRRTNYSLCIGSLQWPPWTWPDGPCVMLK